MISYSRFASLALPPVVAVLGVFVYMNWRLSSANDAVHETAGSAAVGSAPVPRSPTDARAAPVPTSTSDETRAAFDKVYQGATWGKTAGGIGTSGSGSSLAATLLYRTYLQQFMKDNGITSVVDAGCGDWEFSQAIDWTGIDYKGYDIVEAVIARDKKLYAKPNIQFFAGNIIEDDLPRADLLISKHVLQHLSNADVAKFLAKQVPKYKHVLLLNGVHPVAMTARNSDIKPGEYRELDITRPPFNATAARPLTYWATGHMHQLVHIDNTQPR